MLHLYAGIGSRETPVDMCLAMTEIARQLSPEWKLRSGHALKADQAFERGAIHKEIHLPWREYNNAPIERGYFLCPRPTKELCDVAAAHHPVWDQLKPGAKLMMVRNTSIMLGCDLDAPVKMVVCWTPKGAITGGTGHALRIAETYGIPKFNLYRDEDRSALADFVRNQ